MKEMTRTGGGGRKNYKEQQGDKEKDSEMKTPGTKGYRKVGSGESM